MGKVKPASQGSDGPKPRYAGLHGAQTVALVTDGLGLSHFQHTSGHISA